MTDFKRQRKELNWSQIEWLVLKPGYRPNVVVSRINKNLKRENVAILKNLKRV